MNPCKEISAYSIHRQLDSIAEQVAAELLQQYQDGCEEQEAKSSPVCDDKIDTSTSTCVEVGQSCGSTKDQDCDINVAPAAAACGKLQLPVEVVLDGVNVAPAAGACGKLQLPMEVVLDGINTVLYSRLHFSSPSMEQYYNLENSFIDKVCSYGTSL